MNERTHRGMRLTDPAPLAMAAFALPLFVWSAFNAGFFEMSGESFMIPLAVFLGGPIAFATAMWAYQRDDGYTATAAGVFGAFWVSYGMMLWLIQNGVIAGGPTSSMLGLIFAAWAVTFGVVWLGSMREHWTLALVTLGSTLMFALLSIGHYATGDTILRIGGWVGFVTAILAWYAALAEMLNAEFERPVLPTRPDWFAGMRRA